MFVNENYIFRLRSNQFLIWPSLTFLLFGEFLPSVYFWNHLFDRKSSPRGYSPLQSFPHLTKIYITANVCTICFHWMKLLLMFPSDVIFKSARTLFPSDKIYLLNYCYEVNKKRTQFIKENASSLSENEYFVVNMLKWTSVN